MNSAGKNLRIVLMLLAGLVILLHSTIPHHHHLDLPSDHNYSNLGKIQTSRDSSDKEKTHCYAFNSLVFDKVDSNTFNTKTDSNFFQLLVPAFSKETVNSKLERTTFFIQNIVSHIQYFSTELSFRGPPAIS